MKTALQRSTTAFKRADRQWCQHLNWSDPFPVSVSHKHSRIATCCAEQAKPIQFTTMSLNQRPPREAPVESTYSSDGVDLTLIRWMLSLTPLERLEVLQASAGSLTRLREVAHPIS